MEKISADWHDCNTLYIALEKYAEQFIAEDADKIMEYVNIIVNIEDSHIDDSILNVDEIKKYLEDMFSLLGDEDDEYKYKPESSYINVWTRCFSAEFCDGKDYAG